MHSTIERYFPPGLASEVSRLACDALVPTRHGDMPKWSAALNSLAQVETGWRIGHGILSAGGEVAERETLAAALRQLIPWRKGPLKLGGLMIDTEWRSDWKWNRIAPHLDLTGRRVLDIGAGNGYFGWRMLAAGARQVIGCDPTLLFWHQFRAVEHFAGPSPHLLLPLKFEQIPPRADFDTVFSMGVLYHRRDPLEHLQRIGVQLRPGGLMVLETLIIPGDHDDELDPPKRYANMRNVHHLPSLPRLRRWLEQTGFENIRDVDVTATTTREQRTTDWMPFHSLEQALSSDKQTTAEGYPPPLRAVVTARI